MTVDFKISATLVARDELSPALEKALGVAMKLSAQMTALTKNMMRASQSFTTAATGVDHFSSRSADAFNKFEAGSARAKSSAESMNRVMADLASKAAAAGRAFNIRSTVERMDVARHVTIFETQTVGRGAPAPIVPSPVTPSPMPPLVEIGRQPRFLPPAPMLRATPEAAVDRLPSMRMPAPALPMGLPTSDAPSVPVQRLDSGASMPRSSPQIVALPHLPPLPALQIPTGYGLPPVPAARRPADLRSLDAPAVPAGPAWPVLPQMPTAPTQVPLQQARLAAPNTPVWPAPPPIPALQIPAGYGLPPLPAMPSAPSAPALSSAPAPARMIDARPPTAPNAPKLAWPALPPMPTLPQLSMPQVRLPQLPALAMPQMTAPTLPPVRMPALPPVRVQLAPMPQVAAPPAAGPAARAAALAPGILALPAPSPAIALPAMLAPPGMRAPLPPVPAGNPAAPAPSYLPVVVDHQQRAAVSVGAGMQPAWNVPAASPRQMRDIGGSSIADQPVRQRAAAPALPMNAPAFNAVSTLPNAAVIGGGRVPPAQNLPGAYGQPFMPPPARNIGGGSTAGGIGGAGGPPSGGAGRRGGGAGGGAPVDALAYGYVGGMLKGYGDSMLESLHAPIEKAIELNRVIAGLQQKGLGEAQIAEAMKYVRATEIYGTSIIERAKIFNEAQGSFRESGMPGTEALGAAKVMMPVLAAYKVAMGTLGDASHAAAEGSFNQLNKVVELMGGLTDSKRAQSIVDSVFKAVQSSGKMVSERDFRLFRTQGGSAVSNLDDKSTFAALEPIMAELGGSVLGTGMNTAYRRISGLLSRPPKMMVNEAIKMGIWDSKQIQFNSQGGIGKILNRDKLADPRLMELMRTNTIGFAKAMMLNYQAHGITTSAGRERENELLFDRNGAKIYNIVMRQMEVMERSVEAFEAAKGVGQTNEQQKDSPMQKIMEAQKRYADLQMELGLIVLPIMIDSVNRLIPLMKDLSRFVRENAGLVKVLMWAFIGLASVLVFGGSVLLLRGAFAGLGIALNMLTAGAGVPALVAIIGGPLLASIAVAVLAIGTIAAACYAFRALTKEDVDAQRTDGGAHLTAGARARANDLGWKDTDSAVFLKDLLAGKQAGQFATGGTNPKATGTDLAVAIKTALSGVVVKMDGESVGRLVTDHQGREASRPSTGTSGYDSRLSVLRPDYSGL